MHILIICHVYLLRANRQKLKALSEIEGIKLSVIVPERWTDYIRDIKDVEYDEDERYDTYPLPIFFNGQEGKYFYKSLTLLLNRIRPDVILVEQGAYVPSYFQTIIYKKLFSSKSKIGFFTWVNIPYKLNPIMTAVERFNFRNSDFTIAGNRDAEEILIKRGFNRPIKILPQLGIETEVFKKRESSQLKSRLRLEGFVIGYIGRFHSEKGVHLILKACKKLTPLFPPLTSPSPPSEGGEGEVVKGGGGGFSMLLVGRGEEKERLVNLGRELNLLEKLCFVDTVPMEKIADYINCMDVLVMPTITSNTCKEQFGHALIEAMACEVPVIGSTCGEIPNVIGDAGLIFKENDSDELYRHISFLMNNHGKRIALAKKGRERILANYTHKRIAEELVDFLKEITR